MGILPENKVIRFLSVAGIAYLVWLLIYYLLIKEFTNWDYYLNYSIVWISKELFDFFGVLTYIEVESDHVNLILAESNQVGVWVGDECNGFKLFSIFSIFIIAFPGPWKKKMWFIPTGLVLIHLANIIRVMLLVWVFEHYPDSLDFNHNYTFTIFVYSIIFILWWWWAKKFSRNSGEKG